MPHGGRREGAGRPDGARNRRTAELEARAKEAASAIGLAIPDAFDGDAHAFLMTVYRDPRQPLDVRVEAAKAAIRYEKPALAAVDLSMEGRVQHVISPEPMTAEEREQADYAWLAQCGAAH